MKPARLIFLFAVLLACLPVTATSGQTAPKLPFQIGSRLVASAEPPVPRPSTTPCAVTLLHHDAFDDHGNGASMVARAHRFHFTPPAQCAGPWAKVILTVGFSIPAGRQYDRTVSLWMGGVNLYFGTTMEPEPGQAQRWQAARDLTRLSAIFQKPQSGQIILNNWISPSTDEPIYVTARLLFYPLAQGQAAPRVPDLVYSMSANPAGQEAALETPADQLARRFTFPRNVVRARLDVIAQSQSQDERWYTCVDKQYLAETRNYSLEAFEACDGGSFRGVEVLVDGRAAGLAPVYPWIFAGGIEPHLWLPIPALQTTNFLPFQVDLTPFAGLLDDGQPHTVAIRALGAHHFFNVAGNLLLYRDAHADELHGRLLEDTLTPQQPAGLNTRSTLHPDARGRTVGTLDTRMQQAYTLRGVLETPRGAVVTTVQYSEDFQNLQTFARPGPRRYHESIRQRTAVSMSVRRTRNGHALSTMTLTQQDPLTMEARKRMITTGQDFTARVAVEQGHAITLRTARAGKRPYAAHLREMLVTEDHTYGETISPPLDRSRFHYREAARESVTFGDTLGSCYRATLASRHGRLTAMHRGQGCPGHGNRLRSASSPDDPWLLPPQ
ncbi:MULTISPECIES: peptide-N4-asparagine amidase [Acidobacterium]|uniref:Putative lipoprotein n=1 Tax=Acidobacterium capsulatum (strain ATCC 51196 / DSM 11244 / BCRC 80197 / JCM 7670 / NBRC 15755 / NCIMB 13165 / 161) TaxID=240015 RepID=C1F2K4_ACIC5|nr:MULTISPECIES: peptide-N4-asparagine amidase [Acidobacterium]ACO33308.1 putative lipoprotein [Acidobacterium capsulatum ATCC 51196]